MPVKSSSRLCALAVVAASLVGCSLLPDFGKDSMSREEKAKLNLQMGIRYMELGMLDVAKEKLDLAVDLDSGNSETQNALAVYYERIKNYDEASTRYKEVLSRDPTNFSAKSNYGKLLCEQGNFEQGTQLLQEALDAPLNNRAWLSQTNMGLCLLKQNQEAKAEGFFRQALQGNGEYAPALQEMQKISYHNQQYLSARAFLERYLAVAKHSAETLWLAFQTERALGSSQTADDYKDQLLTLFPASKEALEIRSATSR